MNNPSETTSVKEQPPAAATGGKGAAESRYESYAERYSFHDRDKLRPPCSPEERPVPTAGPETGAAKPAEQPVKDR
ncbi:hypothetical protein [Pseudomonas panipatensis]|uniref:hypothetical protein n=1 Tax=Pseudomonas panipatensis TaxID=428992 RepID=UPI0035AE2D71